MAEYMPPWAPRVQFRFDPTRPSARAALDVAVSVRRLRVAGKSVPRDLERRWYAAALRAATADRKRDRVYGTGCRGVGEIERVATVAHGCMLLAHAIVAAERSVLSPSD